MGRDEYLKEINVVVEKRHAIHSKIKKLKMELQNVGAGGNLDRRLKIILNYHDDLERLLLDIHMKDTAENSED